MVRRFLAIAFGMLLLMFPSPSAAAMKGSVPQAAWQAYKQKFLDPVGRIVDDGNGGISHSEGQGYGMLIAVLADDASGFELIWSFTRTQMLLRDDGLVAWKWSPAATPHVTDINNATDGDILIAYALGLAGEQWNRRDYMSAGADLARAILDRTVIRQDGSVLLLPGATGFSAGDRADGPVVNPSYWIFEAFPVLDRLTPSPLWMQLHDDGIALIDKLRFGPAALPADWVSLKSAPVPADGFPAEYGYNALRIPLYVARGGLAEGERLLRFTGPQGIANSVVDLKSGRAKSVLDDPGYRIINHIMACLAHGAVVPDDIRSFTPTLYYPSTLHLLGLSFLAAEHPECL